MLRRSFIVVLLWALFAGLSLAGQPASAASGCDQVSMQAGDCGGEPMATDTCAMSCAGVPCMSPAAAGQEPVNRSEQPLAFEAEPISINARAPDTAPPKRSIS